MKWPIHQPTWLTVQYVFIVKFHQPQWFLLQRFKKNLRSIIGYTNDLDLFLFKWTTAFHELYSVKWPIRQPTRQAIQYVFVRSHFVNEIASVDNFSKKSCTYVILSESRCDRSVAGLPLVGNAQRLRGFLLNRFRLIQQRQLVELLYICNTRGKYICVIEVATIFHGRIIIQLANVLFANACDRTNIKQIYSAWFVLLCINSYVNLNRCFIGFAMTLRSKPHYQH